MRSETLASPACLIQRLLQAGDVDAQVPELGAHPGQHELELLGGGQQLHGADVWGGDGGADHPAQAQAV